MRHHQYNPDFQFVKSPVEFDKFTSRNFLQYCLGATLYMPGTKDILNKILSKNLTDITSIVMCFEDAIQESELPHAENNVLTHLEKIGDAVEEGLISIADVPLIFLRSRNTQQFESFTNRLTPKHTHVLSGFVFPKFHSNIAEEYLTRVAQIINSHNATLYSMPILEGKLIAFQETRNEELTRLKRVLDSYQKQILNVRVGGTDISSLFGVRRGINYSIYDIMSVRSCLSDILNFFTRAEDNYLVSAPVWEYFLADKQDNINHLLHDDIHRSLMNRTPILNDAIDGLLREVILDKANGFVGKTIIHPSHARFVNAMQAVTIEEYEDALQILNTNGGVIKSKKANKMNEINPHSTWAKKIELRAQAFGVVENDMAMLKLISV